MKEGANDLANGMSRHPNEEPHHLLFLSHAGVDTEAARKLTEQIESTPEAGHHHLKVWFDKRDLKPGKPWQEQLEQVLERDSTAFAVYVGSRGVINWVESEVRVALARARGGADYPFIPILSQDCSGSEALPAFARQYQGVIDVEHRPEELAKLLRTVTRQDRRAKVQLVSEPFLGLRAFEEKDTHLFFGRDEDADELVERLKRSRLLMVVGDSGCGKSSLVKAGLVPRFRGGALTKRRDPRSEDTVWHVVETRPRSNPFDSLADSVAVMARAIGRRQDDIRVLRKMVRDAQPQEIADALSDGAPENAKILLIVDQFEELFTMSDKSHREGFVRALLYLAKHDSFADFRVVLTMRRDYYNLTHEYSDLYAWTEAKRRGAKFSVRRMSDEQIKSCIEKPLSLAGVGHTGVFVDRVLSDVGDQPGELALLEMALTESWRRRGEYGGDMLKAYMSIGGTSGALASVAEEIFNKLDNNERVLAEASLIRLVRLGETGGTTRRVATRSEFSLDAWCVLQKLATEDYGRLIHLGGTSLRKIVTPEFKSHESPNIIKSAGESSTGLDWQELDVTAELSHEALVLQWPRYQGWLQNSASDKKAHDRIIESAKVWDEGNRQKADLPTGTELDDGIRLLEKRTAWLSNTEREFLNAGRAALRKEIMLKRSAFVLLLLLAVAAVISTWYAQQNSNIALARQLAAQALNHLRERHDLALLRSLKSYGIADTVEARNSLLTALQDKPALLAYIHEYRSKVYDIAFSPDGRMLASVNESGTISLWDSLTNYTKTCQESDNKIAIRSISFNFDGSMLAASGWQKGITFWDPISCRSIGTLTGNDTPVSTVAFHPKSTILAAGSADGTIRIWRVKEDIVNSHRIDLLEGHESPVWDIVFSPDGSTMASSGWNERVILWTDANNTWERITFGETLTGYSLAFSPDNTKLAVGRSDRAITTFDLKTQKRVDLQTTDHKQAISALAFSTDGKLLASASQDGLIAIWDVHSHRELGKYVGHTATVWSLAFSPKAPILASGAWDNRILLWETRTPQILGQPFWSAAIGRPGRTLSLGCDDGHILLWDLEANQAVGKFRAHQTAVTALAFCPNKNILASGSGDSAIIIWEVSGEGLIKRNMLCQHEGTVWALAFSHDGTMLASGSSDSSVVLWNVDTGEPIDRLYGHRLAVSSVAFSAKNRALLASGSWDKDVLLWNILTRKQIGKLSAHKSPVSTVAFSPDGTVLASGGWDRKIMLWNPITKQQISSPLTGHQGPISSITFSGDGAFIASASWDKSVILWDMAKHEQLGRPFLVHKGIVSDVAFCPDNEYFVSCGLDGSVCMYDGSLDRWRARAHTMLRNVKREELLRDFGNDAELEHRGFLTVLIREDTSKTVEESPLIPADQNLRTYEESVQVGDYVKHNMQAPLAGLVDQVRSTIGEWDNEESFDLPNHGEADFLWFTAGSVSWDFPIDVSAKSQIHTVSFKIEIASEAAAAQWDWPSDITLKINEIDVGTWTVMGDPDGRYGVAKRGNHLPPLASQYGWLITWTIGKSGTYLEYVSRFCSMPKMKISNISIDQINVIPGRSLRVTLKVLGDHGLSIFGDSWGDYPHDPTIVVKYREVD